LLTQATPVLCFYRTSYLLIQKRSTWSPNKVVLELRLYRPYSEFETSHFLSIIIIKHLYSPQVAAKKN